MNKNQIRIESFCNDRLTLSKEADGSEWIAGYAAVWYDEKNKEGTEYQVAEKLKLRFNPKSFDKAWEKLSNGSVIASYDHDYAQILARYPDTLQLSLTNRGLLYKIKYNANDPDHVKVKAKLDGGYLTGSSLTFYANFENFQEGEEYDTAEYSVAILEEVGPVANPAFTGTSALMLSKGNSEAAIKEHEKFKLAKATNERFEKLDKILNPKA